MKKKTDTEMSASRFALNPFLFFIKIFFITVGALNMYSFG